MPPDDPADRAPRFSLPVLGLLALDAILAFLAFRAVRFANAAEAYEVTSSVDIGTDLTAALVGTSVLRLLFWSILGGTVAAALALAGLGRIGRRLHAAWAVLIGLASLSVLAGLPLRIGAGALVYAATALVLLIIGRTPREEPPSARFE